MQYAFCLNCQIEEFHMQKFCKHAKHLDFYVTAVITIFVLEILSYNYWSLLVLFFIYCFLLQETELCTYMPIVDVVLEDRLSANGFTFHRTYQL